MENEKKYKYIIIDTTTDEVILKKSVRDISDFINIIYPENKMSHNTVSIQLRNNTYFYHCELLIKELKW